MSPDFFGVEGEKIDASELTVAKARLLADALLREAIEFASFVEARRASDADVVVIDVEVELPQKRENPIKQRERFAVEFWRTDVPAPEVLALRTDFPRVPHLNLRDHEQPRSLCLYEDYENIRRTWTAPRFVADLRRWLSLTARGTLHQPDQYLEPLLLGSDGVLLLPPEGDSSGKPVRIVREGDTRDSDRIDHVVEWFYKCAPRLHGTVYHRPRTLRDVAALAGGEFVDALRSDIKSWHGRDPSFMNSNLVLVVEFPMQRHAGGPVEVPRKWAFQLRFVDRQGVNVPAPIHVVGELLGVWMRSNGVLALLLQPDITKQGDELLTDVLNPLNAATAAELAVWNGSPPDDTEYCAIGAGALGSQVILNLARAGFGKWIILDNERLWPHNIARHALPRKLADVPFVGLPKAEGLAFFASAIADEEGRFAGVRADVTAPATHADSVSKALAGTNGIVDMSASVTVARHLVQAVDSTARRVSLFMSPAGADLVLLAEDRKRDITLDSLEMQYYRACVSDARMNDHLSRPVRRGRYGASCRDVSSRMPQHLVALHAATAARFLPTILRADEPCISVWRTHADGGMSRISIAPALPICFEVEGWKVMTDCGLLDKLYSARRAKLPRETGGVLLGSFDMERRTIYIVDTIPSPPDSAEYPTLYIRGCSGLAEAVNQAMSATIGMIEYVGEWHSHPRGAPTRPSPDDQTVFAWITEHMHRDGLPAVMMIVGDVGRTSCFVEQIEHEERLIPVHEGV